MPKRESICGSPFRKLEVPLTRKQKISSYWARFVEVPMIGILWLLNKISPLGEKYLAHRTSKKWHFKPIPNLNALSKKAIEYKNLFTQQILLRALLQALQILFPQISAFFRQHFEIPLQELSPEQALSPLLHLQNRLQAFLAEAS